MYIINLKDLKLEKEYNYDTKFLCLPIEGSLAEQKPDEILRLVRQAFDAEMPQNPTAYPTVFTLTITSKDLEAVKQDEAEDFVGVLNIILAGFFAAIVDINKERTRDYRLDIPESFYNLKTPQSILKRAVNYKTKYEKFNLIVKYKDLEYRLCDFDYEGKETADENN